MRGTEHKARWKRLQEMVRLLIYKRVLDKIRREMRLAYQDRHSFGGLLNIPESGGYLLVYRNTIADIAFDTKLSDYGYVKLGHKALMEQIPVQRRKYIRGWFHWHPIIGLSSTDINTLIRLTKFWGECVTLVLQENMKLLVIKTVIGKSLVCNIDTIVKTEQFEVYL